MPIPASPVIFTAAQGEDSFQHNGDRVGLGRDEEGKEAATEAKHVWHCPKYTC